VSKKPARGKNVRKTSGRRPMTPARRAVYDRLAQDMRGNTRALRGGLYSAKVQSGALADAAALQSREAVAAIVDDLGGEAHVGLAKRGLIQRYVALSFVADHLEGHMAQGGVLSTKGKTRSATLTYLSVLDRLARLAAAFGLERKPKQVGDLESFLQQRASATPVLPASGEENAP
jgi:hypothetical protein